MNPAFSCIQRFLSNAFGGIAVMAAISAPAVLGTVAVAIDYVTMAELESRMQTAADSAALGGASEINITGVNEDRIRAIATALALQNLNAEPAPPQAETESKPVVELASDDYSIEVSIVKQTRTVEVGIKRKWQPFFLHLLSDTVTPIAAHSRAQVMEAGLTCVASLATGGNAAVHLRKNARLEAYGCRIYANSSHPNAMRVEDDATIAADFICVVGGFKGKGGYSATPEPMTDCPPLEDPLAERSPPPRGACDFVDLRISSKTMTLDPGTYCGGLRIEGNSNISLNSGIYVIADGPLVVSGTATFTGTYTGFYLAGNSARLNFDSLTTIDLTAPKDGLMAGILIYEDRDNPGGALHKITSNNARRLLGTIYLPQGTLRIDGDAPVAGNSAYTALVVNNLQLDAGPNLILNSDYKSTDVPVPHGLIGNRVSLAN